MATQPTPTSHSESLVSLPVISNSECEIDVEDEVIDIFEFAEA